MSYTITTDTTGQVGVHPRIIKVVAENNTLTEVMTAGFLANNTTSSINSILPTDIVLVKYDVNVDFFAPSIAANGVITLTTSDSGDFILSNPTGDQTISTGNLTLSDGNLILTDGNLVSGSNGNPGEVILFPLTASEGKFNVNATNSPANFDMTLTNAPVAQGTIVSITDPGAAAGYVQVSQKVSDPCANLISFNITVGQAALAAAGHVALITSSGSKQYKIKSLNINKGGTNFSGGGGDRLGQVTDGTTVYSVVPATNMQTLVNSGWGISTPLPYPATAAINTSTVAGANLYFAYSGGSADYTAGSIVVSGLAERVA